MKTATRKRRALIYGDKLTVIYTDDLIMSQVIEGKQKKLMAVSIVQKLVKKRNMQMYQRFAANKTRGVYSIHNIYGVEWIDIEEPLADSHSSVNFKFTKGRTLCLTQTT